MTARRLLLVDGFAPEAAALRRSFDARFAAPRTTSAERFCWDWWHVPGQYTALRTPAHAFFPRALYQRFHRRLVWWGRRTLGCHDVSPPWLSCYVDGCEQRVHTDVPHGPFAFVFSLTRWERRAFRGGETLLWRDAALDYWGGALAWGSAEEPSFVEELAPRFGRLLAFDPRLPHGVRRVEGTREPREGRLVIHGWFLQPRPFIEGPLGRRPLAEAIDAVTAAVRPHLAGGAAVLGALSLHFQVAPSGVVRGLRVLADTTRGPAVEAPVRKALRRAAMRALAKHRFPRQRSASRVTLPLVFER